jgi:hypothetical protein
LLDASLYPPVFIKYSHNGILNNVSTETRWVELARALLFWAAPALVAEGLSFRIVDPKNVRTRERGVVNLDLGEFA